MTEQNKLYDEQTRTVVSDLVLSTNELTRYVISLLDSVSVDVDSLIAQLGDATDKIDEGVASLEQIRTQTLQDIHKAQDDISGVYEVFMKESQKLRNDLAGMYTQADALDNRIDTLEGAEADLRTLYATLGTVADAIEADINTSNIKVRDIQGRIAQAEVDVTGLRSQLSALSVDIQTNMLSVADFEARMSVLEQKVTSAASDIRNISDQISKAVVDINTINQRVAEADQTSRDALSLADTAYATVNSLTIDVNVLSTKLDSITNTYNQLYSSIADANAAVAKVNSDVNTLIDNVNSTTTGLTNRLAVMGNDLQEASVRLDSATSALNQMQISIEVLNQDYQSLNGQIQNQILDATNAVRSANTTATELADRIAVLTSEMIEYSTQAGQANQNIQQLKDDLSLAKTDLDNKIQDTNTELASVRAESLSLNNDTRGLRNEVSNLKTEVDNKAAVVANLSAHVDSQVAYVDLRVSEIDSEYLHKLERAADTALFMGKEIGYFAHDGNFESKLDASTGVATIRGEIAAIKSLMSVDNESLNSLQEIVDFIEQNRQDLENLGIANIAGLQVALDGKLGITAKAVDSTLFDGQAIGYFVHDGNFNSKLDTQAVVATLRTDITARSLSTHNHDTRYLRKDVDGTGAGNVAITAATTRVVSVTATAAGNKGSLQAYGNGTSAGELYVGKSNAIGGGMAISGVSDATAAGLAIGGGGIDNVVLYRQTAVGTREWTARNAITSNDWEFRGTLRAQGVFDGVNRVFSAEYLPEWAQVTNKPVQATRWPTYAEVTGKPTSFVPSAHTHLWADLTDKPLTFTPSVHSHLWADLTDKPATFTPSEHNHYNAISQGRVAAWSGTTSPTYQGISMVQAFTNGYDSDYGNVLNMRGDVDTQLLIDDAGQVKVRSKAATGGATWSNWFQLYSSLNKVSYADLLNVPTEFAPSAHVHPWAQITGVPVASVSAAGIVQLSSATNSTSATLAATSAAVKVAYDLAAGKVSKTSDTMTGTLTAANVLISGTQGTAANAVARRDFVETKLTKDLSQYFNGYLLAQTADYLSDANARNLGYSGFFRPNGATLDTQPLPSLMVHVSHPAYPGASHARGVGFDYGGTGWGAYVTRFDAEGVYLGRAKIYTEQDKPTAAELSAVPDSRTVNGKALTANIAITAADVGLGSVNNWVATSAVNDASNAKYATAGAVKTAYDLAANALPKNGGGSVIGPIESTGANGKFQVLNPNDGSAMAWFGFINDRSTVRYDGTGVGASNGFQVVGTGDAVKMYVDNTGEIFAKGTERVFHTSNLPTAAQVGALGLATGGTVLGMLTLAGIRNGMNSFGLFMDNQNIGAVNGIFFNDVSEAANEGLMFPKSGKLGNSTSAADFDNVYARDGRLYINTATVYDSLNKPTAADVGLGSVQDWTYSNSYTGGSASKYATEKAVTDAYTALNTGKASKGGDTFSAQMIFANGANSIGPGGDLTKAWALFGTTSAGLGIDPNEIHQKGDNLYVSVYTGKDIQMRVAGTTRLRVTATGASTENLSASSVTLIGGPTMAYNSTTGCLEITFA